MIDPIANIPDDRADPHALRSEAGLEAGAPSPAPAPAPALLAADWPEDWRTRLADGDQRLERRLARFETPRKVVDSLLSAEQRLRGAGARPPPPTPEGDADALAAWRADMGVPEAPDAYEIELPDGAVLGEADRPLVDAFLESAHAAHMTPDQVNQALGWYYRQHDEMAAAQAALDGEAHTATLSDLKAAWGRDFSGKVNMLHAFLDDAPEGLKENLLGARMADGALFGDSAPALLWLEQLARAAAPAGTLAPASPGGAARAIADEISAIERRMADDRPGYFKDETAQARYRELLAAKGKSRGR